MKTKIIPMSSKVPLLLVQRLSTTLLGAASLSLVLPISAQASTSSVDQITIYQGLASVTRSLPINGSGEQIVTFSCLSPYIDQDSLSVHQVLALNLSVIYPQFPAVLCHQHNTFQQCQLLLSVLIKIQILIVQEQLPRLQKCFAI